MTQMTNERNDTHIHDALARLRSSVEIPAVDPRREDALLAAFDARWAGPRPATSRRLWTAAAILTAIAVGLNGLVIRNAQRTAPAALESDIDMVGFVAWPGADAYPPFESGSLVRVDLPVAALPGLGLSARSSDVTVVQADIVIGQDGFARAVRLVQ